MNTITKTVIIAALIILAFFAAGCIISETAMLYRDLPPSHTSHWTPQETGTWDTPTCEPTAAPTTTPTYTKIYVGTDVKINHHDSDGNYCFHELVSIESTIPHTEYDWTERTGMTIEDVLTSANVPYDYVETMTEQSSCPTTRQYVMSGQYIIHGEGNIVTMGLSVSAVRY